MTQNTVSKWSAEDHDLLIEMKSEIGALRADVREMKDTSQFTIQDHETRLRFIERYMWLAIGALGLLEIIINIWMTAHK